MIDCVWKVTGDQITCVNCARQYPPRTKNGRLKFALPARWPQWACPASPDLLPAAEKLGVILERADNWRQTLAQWLAAGMPERTPDQQAACRQICLACEFGHPKAQCRAGGCAIAASRPPLVVCWRMATWDCGENRWPPW
jgi:hypothetical protein